ncbi:hypothetical protein [Nocardioides sp. GY 10127]|uniref:hypothetical protein n=1 Tax=Nocardioides sp. GY 10127 TaxID=2569762 RepID=UPI0010A8868B|nr:hypothetical protein [Nocardioides sp. GY 10127]TIC84380.1 hypothetical protein E8D37_06325 [Nocardioides sp. GY 10127]
MRTVTTSRAPRPASRPATWAVLGAALLLGAGLTACSADSSDDSSGSSSASGSSGSSSARADASSSSTLASDAATMPTSVPSTTKTLMTRDVVLVLDDGSGAEACLGPIAQTVPPQCTGTPLDGFSFADEKKASWVKRGGVTYGQFELVGTWDGETFTVRTATPAADYDGPSVAVSTPAPPLRRLTDDQLAAISQEVSGVPGVTGSYVGEDSQVVATTPWDDGSIQEYCNVAYGTNTVQVVSVLVRDRT